MPGVGRLLEPSAHHLDDEWIFEEFCWPERVTLVQLDVELGSGEGKRQLTKFAPLIKIEDVLQDIISADRVHNVEFRFHIKPTNILLIFETSKVESRPRQLADTKLGHVFRVASPVDNDQMDYPPRFPRQFIKAQQPNPLERWERPSPGKNGAS
jgi:hypothetical protein